MPPTKRVFDIIVASIILVIVLVPLAWVMVLVRLTSKGDALFCHTRVGRDGRPFKMYKLRSMRAGTQTDDVTPFFKDKQDPRVTPLGRLLRKTSLDELPQLINVIKGDMSLVGPRPQVASEVARYDERHRGRLAVRPGMTGLWQVSGRSDLDVEYAMSLDLRYIEHHSMWLDLRIMFKTVFVLTRGAY